MDDIAKRADVSKSTVSLVLNQKPGVSTNLADVVRQAAEELGYRHPRQRGRRAASSRCVAVVHAQSASKTDSSIEPTDLYLDYLTGIRTFAQTNDLNLSLIANYSEDDRQKLAFRLLHNDIRNFDGLIVMGGDAYQNSQLIRQIIEEKIPAVALSRYWPDLAISTVGPDYRQQVHLALDHLIALGHKQIAFVNSEDDQRFGWHLWRLNHYRETMRELHGHVDEELIAVGASGAEAVVSLLQRRPDVTAIFAINDERAVEALAGLQQLGLSAPQDISVIGQDNVVELMGDEPILTTVGFPHVDVGYLAGELLIQQMQSSVLSYSNLWVQCQLVERTSCRELAGRPLPA